MSRSIAPNWKTSVPLAELVSTPSMNERKLQGDSALEMAMHTLDGTVPVGGAPVVAGRHHAMIL